MCMLDCPSCATGHGIRQQAKLQTAAMCIARTAVDNCSRHYITNHHCDRHQLTLLIILTSALRSGIYEKWLTLHGNAQNRHSDSLKGALMARATAELIAQ